MLMRVEEQDEDRCLHVIRRTGEVVRVQESAIVTHKLIPPATRPLKAPPAWEEKT